MTSQSDLLALVRAAAAAADYSFWVNDLDGDSVRLANCRASTAQAIESLTDPGEGWVRVDESAWGQRQANPLAGFVYDGRLQDAINTACEAEIDVETITAAIDAGRA